MTVIVGVCKGGEIALASDTLVSFGTMHAPTEVSRDVKIFTGGGACIGISGWGVYGVLLEDYVASHDLETLTDKLSVFRFFKAFQKSLHDDYHFVDDNATGDDSPFSQFDSSFLVGTKRGLFRVTSAMSVTEMQRYWAIGSGCEYALGAVHATYDSDRNAEELAQIGAAAGIAFDDGCGGPIQVERVSQ